MDPLRTGARMLSRGMREANTAVTLFGALLVFRAVIKWLDGPSEELVYTRRLKRGEQITIELSEPEGQRTR